MITERNLHRPFGRTGMQIPSVVFGTSCLGNLYQAIPEETKFALVSEMIRHCPAPVVLDSAGKYGAGLALEVIGRTLHGLRVPREGIVISNKLGWYRTPLRGTEPTFERGVWVGIGHDAELRVSYDGILQCHEQGCRLLGSGYAPQLVSLHDPDEFLAAAKSPSDRKRRFQDVLGAYEALFDLKARGAVRAVGIGSKDWRVIHEIAEQVDLDWVMFACSLTVYSHPPELLAFIAHLQSRGVGMINSAVFHAGFLTGGRWFDYRQADPVADARLFAWRERFHSICERHLTTPADVCVRFSLAVPGIAAVALNTEKPERIRSNLASASADVPAALWRELKEEQLISWNFPIGD